MSIQTKIIAVLVFVLGALLFGDLFVLDRVVLEGFRKLENQEVRREMGRTMASVEDEVRSLDPLASNWGSWDALASYAKTSDDDFARRFLTETDLITHALDLTIVINLNRRVVFKRIQNRKTGNPIRAVTLDHAEFPEDHPLLAHGRSTGKIRGTIATESGPMLVVAAPLLGAAQRFPASGTVIVGRLMDKAAVSRISGQMNNALEMTPITDDMSNVHREMVNQILARNEPVIDTGQDGSWTAFIVQRDLFGYPAALYSITTWSIVHRLGINTVRTAGMMAILAVFVVLGSTLFLLRFLIVKPIANMKQELLSIRASGDMSKSLSIKGADEFSLLAGEINDLLNERTEFENALEVHQAELERRVEERTYELQREIADKEAAQETLRFAEFSLSHSGESLFWLRRDQRLLYVNEATCRHLGYTQAELLNMSYADFSDGPPPEQDWDSFWEDLRSGRQIQFETRHRRKDGSAVPVEVRASVMEYAGEEFLFAFAQDISRRLAREQALVDSERRFRTLTEEANQGIVVHRGFYPLYVNPAFLRIFGFESHIEFLQAGNLEITLAPEEVARIRGYDLARMQGQEASSDYIYRGVKKDGTELWLNNRSFMIDWGDGPAVCTVLFDVTEARDATQQLYLMESAVQEASDPFFAVNKAGQFIYVNDASCNYLGYSRDELLSMNVSQINQAREHDWNDRWEFLKDQGHFVSFGEHYRKDGTTYPVEITSSYVAHDGEEYVFAFARDISERVRTETELRQARDELEQRVQERTRELTREVEERRRAEQAVQQSETRLRAALESLQEGFALFDADDRLVLMNSRYADSHPRSEEILKNSGTFEDIVRANLSVIADATGREEEFMLQRLAEHRDPGPPIIREFTDGRWFLLRESKTSDGGTTLTATDITELKTIEADLKHKTEMFDTAVRAMNNGIVVLDEDLRFVTFNEHYVNLFGFPPGVVREGGPLSDAVRFLAERGEYGEIEGSIDELVARQCANVPINRDTVIRRTLATGRTIETRRGLLPNGGVVGIHVDITESVQFEDRLREARDAAENANTAKSAFLANMSHEIRTPMNGILGVTEMLHETPLSSTQRGMLDIVQDSCRTLMGIIDDILDFSKIEAGRLELDVAPFSISVLVETVAELLAPRAEEKRNRLNIFIDPSIPDELVSDQTRIRQILLNLVGNAVKFTENGRIDVEVRSESTDDDPYSLIFRIHDTGVGISEEHKSKLFRPFEQGDSSTMRRFGGTGLGLSICHALVDMLDGEIGADSRKGQGSTFWFQIPMKPNNDPASIIGRPFSGYRAGILVTDNFSANTIDTYLRHLGADTEIIPSLRALENITSADRHVGDEFDFLVLDHDRGARGVARFLTGRKKAKDPISSRIIILMPRSNILTNETDALAGHHLFVPKPVQRSVLWNAAAMALGLNLPGIGGPARKITESAALPQYTPPDLEHARDEGALVLFAEDNPVNRNVICMMLERLGIAVETAANGADAWNRIRRHHYGMLITDCHMPKMDGYELTERIRAFERAGHRPALPIIALTADALIGTKEKCRAAGMDGHLPKPVDRATLNEVIQQWLPKAIQLRRPVGDTTAGAAAPETNMDAILDLRYIHDAVGGDESMVAPLLQDYLRNTRRLVDDMLEAFLKEDYVRAREAAHAAKGTSRLAGAVRFANLCEQIELDIRAGNTSNAALMSRRIEPELAIVAQAVAGHESHSLS